jgi:GT2 family glycosyltransferase
MIDVIIPTIMQSDKEIFQYTLEQMNSSEVVNKIIIIDNTDNQQFREAFKDIITPKYQIIDQLANLYVNAAWQHGMEQVEEGNYYLLLNDDILCDKIIFEQCQEKLDMHPKCGLITVKTEQSIDIKAYNNIMSGMTQPAIFTTVIPYNRQGWFMCGRLSQWTRLPSQIKIFYGDDFIYREIRKKGLNCVLMCPYCISHYESTSVNAKSPELRKLIRDMIKKDVIEWNKL